MHREKWWNYVLNLSYLFLKSQLSRNIYISLFKHFKTCVLSIASFGNTYRKLTMCWLTTDERYFLFVCHCRGLVSNSNFEKSVELLSQCKKQFNIIWNSYITFVILLALFPKKNPSLNHVQFCNNDFIFIFQVSFDANW